MERRYQVFVSSTFTDLKDARTKVIQTLMQMDCIPAGMELFPAADEEQFEFIKRIIDDCDYYVVVIGGRYGTLTSAGISFTEKEYDYAVERGLKVVAFVHENPDELARTSDPNPELRAKLDKFRAKVSSGRIVKMWSNPDQLPGLVALSMLHTMRTYPAVGWVRANAAASAEVLTEINELRKRNAQLEESLASRPIVADVEIPDLAPLNARFNVSGRRIVRENKTEVWRRWDSNPSWGEIFGFIGPHLLTGPLDETAVRNHLAAGCLFEASAGGRDPELYDPVFQTIKVQLLILNFVGLSDRLGDWGEKINTSWSISPQGRRALFEAMAVRANQKPQPQAPEPEREPEPATTKGDFDDDIPF